jgi:cell division protein FtsZ
MADSDPQAPPAAPQKAFVIKVLGVGGAGCNAVAHFARELLPGVTCTALNTDESALAQSPVDLRVVLGKQTTRGLGAGGDPERGKAAAEEDAAQIRALCQGADIVFVVAGLGGGTGTGAGPVIARIAKELNALVLGLCFTPFEFEGNRRQRQAQLGLLELKRAADGVICLPNQRMLKLIDEKTSLLEAFAITHEYVAQGVRGIWRLLAKPGLINVDFADLCAVTQDRHAEGVLATAEAKGENRDREIVQKLLDHPLLEQGHALADAAGVLISIAGGPDLSMAEVNRIMEQFSRHCEHAHLILGAAIDEMMAGRLAVTLVAGRHNPVLEPPERCEDLSLAPGPGALETTDLDRQLACPAETHRPHSRFVAPPPVLTPEHAEQLMGRRRKKGQRLRQGQLPLEIVSRGRFEKSEPTLHQGQDLDVPTYIRRGVALN